VLGKVAFLGESVVNSDVSGMPARGSQRERGVEGFHPLYGRWWSDTAARVASPLRRDLKASPLPPTPQLQLELSFSSSCGSGICFYRLECVLCRREHSEAHVGI